MKMLFPTLAATMLVACSLPWSVRAAPPAKPSAAQAVVVRPAQLSWQDVPPFLPKGAKIALLEGDPAKPGAFTVRLRLPPGSRIPMHTSSSDEHVTVIFGHVVLKLGEGEGEGQPLPMRAYASLPAAAPRALTARGMTVLQVSGSGPWELRFVDPKDDPRTRPAETAPPASPSPGGKD